MSSHTTFRVGGPADLYAVPRDIGDLRQLLAWSSASSVPVFVLGGGANILVSDAGIRGLVIDMAAFNSINSEPRDDGSMEVEFGAGLPISDASAWAADHALAGLAFIYSMPGSVAGAVWMNARCYGAEISEVLSRVDVVSRTGTRSAYVPQEQDFQYKRSPFQESDDIMTAAAFRLQPGNRDSLRQEMLAHESDRRSKGHFAAPCAGSVFKNNRAFGKPTGALLDDLGMRGLAVGGACVSDLHANIIINTGSATAADIRALAERMASEASSKLGITLEREILFAGDWEEQCSART